MSKIMLCQDNIPPKDPYIEVVVGLAWSNDPESYAGSSITTSRAFCARHVKGDGPDKKG
jgi:hypothetical protein